MRRSSDYYIDLGTANTLIYSRRKGFLLNEPSVLALRGTQARRDQLFALGGPAKLMLGKTPENISIHRPLREGVIADFDNTARMLHAFIKRIKANSFWFRPRLIISLPCQVTEFEKRAVRQVGLELGAGRVHLLDEPVAAAIGAGLPVLSSRGQMVVDIGGGTTEIAVIALGGIVTSRAVRIGGDKIDDGIARHLRSKFNFVVGGQTAERIKIQVASLLPEPASGKIVEAGGIDLHTGLPAKMRVGARTIFPAVDNVAREIIAAIRLTLEKCAPEISGDIAEDGISLAGGGALLNGLRARLENDLSLKVRLTPDPLLSVALGGARALDDSRLFDLLDLPA